MSISVNSVSFVPHLALKMAGISPYRPPPMHPARNMVTIRSQCGQRLPYCTAMKEQQMAPTRICPSPPMFQKRILNAIVRPSEVIRSSVMILMVA